MRVALYCCETAEQPSLQTQEGKLRLIASERGWEVVEVFKDHFLKGYDTRHGRDSLYCALKESPSDFHIVMVWSMYCAANTLKDLVTFVNLVSKTHHGLLLFSEGIDTSRSSDKGLLAAISLLADFDRQKIQVRVCSSIAAARNRFPKTPTVRIDAELRAMIEMDLRKGVIGQRKIAAKYCVALGSVQKISAEIARKLEAQESKLTDASW